MRSFWACFVCVLMIGSSLAAEERMLWERSIPTKVVCTECLGEGPNFQFSRIEF